MDQEDLPDLGHEIDKYTFAQVYDMDEDGDHSFSLQIVMEFFEQAHKTFEEMDDMLLEGDLTGLSEKGHYLKGSSATLGLMRVKDSCEQIQRMGKTECHSEAERKDCLQVLASTVFRLKHECNRAERILTTFYDLPVPEELNLSNGVGVEATDADADVGAAAGDNSSEVADVGVHTSEKKQSSGGADRGMDEKGNGELSLNTDKSNDVMSGGANWKTSDSASGEVNRNGGGTTVSANKDITSKVDAGASGSTGLAKNKQDQDQS